MPDPRVTSSTRPTTTTTTTAEQPPAAGLSLPQVGGGALAAVTAAVAASFLGVGGTLVGAAVGSVISTIAAVLYSNSLSRAARVSRTLVVRQTLAPAAPRPQPEDGEPADEPQPQHPEWGSVWRRIRWKPVLLVAAGVFVAAMAVISVSELALGHPIANAGESGTTLSNLGRSSSQPSKTPTPTGTPTPSSSSGTQTPTPTASGTPTDASPNPTSSSPSTSPTSQLQTTAPTTASSTATTAPTGG
jgi:hypothetical protein